MQTKVLRGRHIPVLCGDEGLSVVFHCSRVDIEPGTALESRIFRHDLLYEYEVLEAALNESPATLKALLLEEVLRTKNQGRNLQFVLREIIFSRVRVSEFPTLPDRLSSVFVSPTKEDARLFRDGYAHERALLFECELDGLGFLADLSWVRTPSVLLPLEKYLEEILENARHYWRGDHSDEPVLEILAKEGSVQVTARADW